MKRRPLIAVATVTVVASMALAPAGALANRARGGAVAGRFQGAAVVGQGHSRASGFGNGGFGHGGFAHRGFAHHGFGRPFFHRPFVGTVIPFGWGTSVVVAAPPYYADYPPPQYYMPPTYYDPSLSSYPSAIYGGPSGSVAIAPTPPSSTPSVVQYPHGRYELRGDGITTPYTWVWIPNPPPPPPPSAPPSAPSELTPPGPPAAATPSAARHGRLYRWTDEQGVVHWTDNPDIVPEQYRSQATRI